MARWEPDSRGRLVRAALDLYGERGFEHTTVAEIAERAGVTERTFFRYFADKREVLFDGGSALEEQLVRTVVDAPADAAPVEAITAGLEAVAAVLQERRPFARQRHRVITANPELQERELIKLSAWGSAMTDALRRRGVPSATASLTAEVGMAVFRVAFERWVDDADDQDLAELIRDSVEQLHAVTAVR
jgi:AcrR family transcriptional regulator